MAYYFYLGKTLLPVTPEKVSLKIKNQNKTMNVINDGEINFLKTSGLTDIEFDCSIPMVQQPYAVYTNKTFKSPAHFLSIFESLKAKKKPFTFKILRKTPNGKLLFDTVINVSLESYNVSENAKDGMDLTVSVKLKQYKEFGTKEIKVSKPKSTSTSTKKKATVTKKRNQDKAPTPKKDKTYKVKSGDCLWAIAKKFYGDGSLYPKIYKANKDKIKNPNLIYVGQVLKIPAGNEGVRT